MSDHQFEDQLIWTGKNVEAFRAAICRLMPRACISFDLAKGIATLREGERVIVMQPGDYLEWRLTLTQWGKA